MKRFFFEHVFLEKVAGNLIRRGLLGKIPSYFWFQLISGLGVGPGQQQPEECALREEVFGEEIFVLFELGLPNSLTGLYDVKRKAP